MQTNTHSSGLVRFERIRTRIAPTPSGFLHIGNALGFLRTWLLARLSPDGALRLRIDDLDNTRQRPEYVEDIFESLDWLGLDWDAGAMGVADFYQHHSQLLRLDRYRAVLAHFQALEQTYACDCSRQTVRASAQNGQYARTCLGRALPKTAAESVLRLRTTAAPIQIPDWAQGQISVCLDDCMRDFVICGKHQHPAYMLASVVDDVDFGCTHLVRGADLLPSSAAQLYLAAFAPMLEAFAQTAFWHHGLVLDENGQKLSKSAGAPSLRAWRALSDGRARFFAWASEQLGAPRCASAGELLGYFKQMV